MTPALRLHGLGAVVEVRCAGRAAPTLKAAQRRAWSRCLVGEDCAADGERGPVAPEVLEASLDAEEYLPRALMTTTQVVTRSLIRAQAGRLRMLHAGAVSHAAAGASLVYVAPGGTGTTTLDGLSVIDAVFAVVEETSSLPRLEGPLHRLADLLDRGGPVLRVRYSEAPDIKDGSARLIGGGV